jgi:hypothetical protein
LERTTPFPRPDSPSRCTPEANQFGALPGSCHPGGRIQLPATNKTKVRRSGQQTDSTHTPTQIHLPSLVAAPKHSLSPTSLCILLRLVSFRTVEAVPARSFILVGRVSQRASRPRLNTASEQARFVSARPTRAPPQHHISYRPRALILTIHYRYKYRITSHYRDAVHI